MKKSNKINKIIILSVIALIFIISAVIFILNYTKDSSSLSILEKNWISNHNSKVIDVSVYNDVPVYGQDGEGIIFSFLDEFTKAYDVSFNKVSYLTSGSNNLRNVAFRILPYGTELGNNDILMYKDYYVIVSLEEESINDISSLSNSAIGIFDEDINNIRYYLNDSSEVKYTNCKDKDEMLQFLKSKDIKYAVIPNNLYLNMILENNLKVVYHLNELYKNYVLTVNGDNTLRSIMNKFNMVYDKTYKENNTKTYLLNTLFKNKKITEVERMNYNSQSYTFGYITMMPYQGYVNKEFVGILSNYLSGFEKLANVDFKMVEYKSISDLKAALSSGDIDLVFGNFDTTGVKVDILNTGSLFKEEYYVLSNNNIAVNSIRSLKGMDAYTVNGTKLYDYLGQNGVNTIAFNNSDDLLRNIRSDSIVVIDKDTYEYYKDNKFRKYKIIYTGVIDKDYTFAIRDVNKNKTFYDLFDYYVMSINYKDIRYNYNTDYIVNSKNEVSNMLKYLVIIFGITGIVFILIFILLTVKNKKKNLNKEDKLKFIDVMTSLKNRNYLNYNIKTWEDNVIYPQAIVIIDLNNIKYINDNYGHEEGDNVIKKAANILLNNQQENTDIIRTDGNEFLVYMVGYDEKKVIDYTRKISREMKELPHEYGAAIGYSMIIDDIKTIDDAINEATLSMRQAKDK